MGWGSHGNSCDSQLKWEIWLVSPMMCVSVCCVCMWELACSHESTEDLCSLSGQIHLVCACVCVQMECEPVGKRESLPWFHSCSCLVSLGGFFLPAVAE